MGAQFVHGPRLTNRIRQCFHIWSKKRKNENEKNERKSAWQFRGRCIWSLPMELAVSGAKCFETFSLGPTPLRQSVLFYNPWLASSRERVTAYVYVSAALPMPGLRRNQYPSDWPKPATGYAVQTRRDLPAGGTAGSKASSSVAGIPQKRLRQLPLQRWRVLCQYLPKVCACHIVCG
jgi:hypothetical protein